MKKLKLILIISIIFFFSNCDKEKEDYQEMYIGNWEFNVITKYYLITGPDVQIDTVNYISKIEKTSSINQMYIQYLKDRNITATVNEKGELFFTYENCNGKFENNNIVQIYIEGRGKGGKTIQEIKGKKL